MLTGSEVTAWDTRVSDVELAASMRNALDEHTRWCFDASSSFPALLKTIASMA
jgi:hypothetical protein